MSQSRARKIRTVLAATCATAGLLVGPLAMNALAGSTTAVSAGISVVGVSPPSGGHMALHVRYRCTPGTLTQLVGIYGSRSFDWVASDELYGQEESRVFDVPCTGRYERATIKLVTNGRVPQVVHVHAGIGVSDPESWSFEVANDSERLRRR